MDRENVYKWRRWKTYRREIKFNEKINPIINSLIGGDFISSNTNYGKINKIIFKNDDYMVFITD